MVENNRQLSARLVCNNKSKKIKVLNEIRSNLDQCTSFSFSVAFINDAGLQCIKQSILNLSKKGIKGRLITSTYLNFNSPKIFNELQKFNNLDVRIFKQNGFHPKGYIFSKDNERNIIIGSSNITDSALTTNQEWNICLNSLVNENIVERIEDEFEEQWNLSSPLTNEWIEEYSLIYEKIEIPSFANKNTILELKPNYMQSEALNSLNALREDGKRKALLISATGTGKTYLSAFDVKQFNANRILFVVHRESIAKKALQSFKKIMPEKSYGLYCGTEKNKDADYIFSTIQTIGKEEHLKLFDKKRFDYIIIDEVHHLGAESYQILFSYFEPKFLLGMTATPERTDGYDIYKDFDYNVAYEIRLQQAMEEDLLCQFHYFGISDIKIDGKEICDESDVDYLTCEERVNHIIDAANTYSFSGDKVHGLIFVSRIDEAKRISEILNNKGYRTSAIVGETSDVEGAIDRLESSDKDCYDYLVCVDKFNEGIDIPNVNQIIMARPTNSAIIFIQQLGRGLRKSEGKDYTVIIDLIGNYKKNFMIPIALSGDKTYDVDAINKYMISGKQFLPGSSTINFDEIARERIFESIEKIDDLNDVIKKSYDTLQYKIGRRPYLIDFYNEKEVDPLLIAKKYKSYYMLAKQKSDECYNIFSVEKIRSLNYFTKLLLNGKRIIEILIIEYLLKNKKTQTAALFKYLNNLTVCTDECFDASLNYINGGFETTSSSILKNKDFSIIKYDDMYVELTQQFLAWISSDNEYLNEFKDILNTAKNYYNDKYSNSTGSEPFVLFEKYSRSDVARLYNADKDISSIMYGMYRFNDDACIFVTYKKEDPTDESNYVRGKPDYSDSFIDERCFEWMTKIGMGKDSNYYKEVITAKNRRLFIQKSTNDSNFYYVGKVDIISDSEEIKKDNNNISKKIVRVQFLLEKPIEKELLDYFNCYDYKRIQE